jgi:hypothetical protein
MFYSPSYMFYSIFPPTPTLIYYEGVFYSISPLTPTLTLIYEGGGGGEYRVKHTLIIYEGRGGGGGGGGLGVDIE